MGVYHKHFFLLALKGFRFGGMGENRWPPKPPQSKHNLSKAQSSSPTRNANRLDRARLDSHSPATYLAARRLARELGTNWLHTSTYANRAHSRAREKEDVMDWWPHSWTIGFYRTSTSDTSHSNVSQQRLGTNASENNSMVPGSGCDVNGNADLACEILF